MDFWPFGVSPYHNRHPSPPSFNPGFPYGGAGHPYSAYDDIPSAYRGLNPDVFDNSGLFGWPARRQPSRKRHNARSRNLYELDNGVRGQRNYENPTESQRPRYPSNVCKCANCSPKVDVENDKSIDHETAETVNSVHVPSDNQADRHGNAVDTGPEVDSPLPSHNAQVDEVQPDPGVIDTEEKQRRLQAIKSIDEKVELLKGDINSFSDVKGSKRYLYLSETLVSYLLQLDQIMTDGNQDIRKSRKQAVLKIEEYILDLEGRCVPTQAVKSSNDNSIKLEQGSDEGYVGDQEKPEDQLMEHLALTEVDSPPQPLEEENVEPFNDNPTELEQGCDEGYVGDQKKPEDQLLQQSLLTDVDLSHQPLEENSDSDTDNGVPVESSINNEMHFDSIDELQNSITTMDTEPTP